MGWGCCRDLKALNLSSSCGLKNKDAVCVGRAMSRGSLRALQEFMVSNDSEDRNLTAVGLAAVTRGLSDGEILVHR